MDVDRLHAAIRGRHLKAAAKLIQPAGNSGGGRSHGGRTDLDAQTPPATRR
jgi:hypothetical protein